MILVLAAVGGCASLAIVVAAGCGTTSLLASLVSEDKVVQTSCALVVSTSVPAATGAVWIVPLDIRGV